MGYLPPESRIRTLAYWKGDGYRDQVEYSLDSTPCIEVIVGGSLPSCAGRPKLFLCDVEGVDAKEVCDILKITETNHYVRLHRTSERVRQAVEIYLEGRPLTV